MGPADGKKPKQTNYYEPCLDQKLGNKKHSSDTQQLLTQAMFGITSGLSNHWGKKGGGEEKETQPRC